MAKAKYRDEPRFSLIYKYEGAVKAKYRKSIITMVKELGVSMKGMVDKQIK